MNQIKHLYQRTVTKKGKKSKVWYFWFYDENGKQVRRSCGTSIKREAEQFVAQLNETEIINQISPSKKPEKLLLKDFCAGMMDEDSFYRKKKTAEGVINIPVTINIKKRRLERILERFGDYDVSKIESYEIEQWLFGFDYCNATRNAFLYMFKEIFKQLYYFKKIDRIPLLEYYKKINRKKRGILNLEEIQTLFPKDYQETINKWKWKTRLSEPDYQIFIVATFFYTCLATGMRSGEIRALTWSQFIREDAVLINAMLRKNEARIDHLKKATDVNPRYRIAILPQKAVEMLKYMRTIEPPHDNDYVFTYRGNFIQTSFLQKKFHEILNKNGIKTWERGLTIHSLRFTYNSLMRNEISGDDLRLMLGHLSEKMTDYYDKSNVTDHLPELLKNRTAINEVFS